MDGELDILRVRMALERLGAQLSFHRDVHILLVGGAAGMLIGELARDRVTSDCDVIDCDPPAARDALDRAAAAVASELGLPARWLNDDVQMLRDTLPKDWRSRRHFIAQHRDIHIWAVDRRDLIAMKVFAGRDQDIEDIGSLRPTRDELAFVREHLAHLAKDGRSASELAPAHALLAALEEHAHE